MLFSNICIDRHVGIRKYTISTGFCFEEEEEEENKAGQYKIIIILQQSRHNIMYTAGAGNDG